MSNKKPKQKDSSKSKKEKPKKEEELNLSEYEDSFDDEHEGEPIEETGDEIDYEEYELPEDFIPEDKDEADEEVLNWFQKRRKDFQTMDNYQRLYWIKILAGTITGLVLGFANAQTGWWLFLMIVLYAGVTAGGFYLFKLEWNFKEIIFSGFFPYLALFVLTWTLMLTSLYAPPISDWWVILETIVTETINGTETIYTSTRTTSAADIPYLAFVLIIVSTLGLLQFLLRKQNRREK